ncbi:MAG: hypothetical protein AAF387_16345 [Pseudomonadota bacterium]
MRTSKPNLLPFVALSTIAMPMLVGGILGFVSPETLPWPPNPTLNWALLIVGGLLDGAAVVILLQELRRVRAR